MEGLREIATAYYERSNDHEKGSVKEFFRKLNINGDGKVSLAELKKSIGAAWLANEKIFRRLDENGDGTLDFDQVLAVYYMVNKVKLLACNGCRGLLVGPYFSCLLCLGKSPDTFDLCCSCYRQGNVSHEHSDEYLLDYHSLLWELRKRSAEAEKGRRKREMEELREIANAHYQSGSPKVQDLAYDFFKAMDADGDGRVDLQEFLAFMSQQGYPQMLNPSFYTILDHDGNGTLDFHEVMTLYYIMKSGRPFCNSCKNFIPGTFFSCVECCKYPERSFNLCRDCYCSTKCKHDHDGRVHFLDNYTFLEAKRDSSLAQATSLKSNQTRATTSNGNTPMKEINAYMNTTYPAYTSSTYPTYMNTPYSTNSTYPTYMNTPYPTNNTYPTYMNTPYPTNMTYPTYMNATYPTNIIYPTYTNTTYPMNTAYPTYMNATYPACPPSPMPNYSNAIVPAASSWNKWKIALQALETALSIGSISSTLCTIL